MDDKIILSLIRCHYDRDEKGFREAAFAAVQEFREKGKDEVAQYALAQMSEMPVFIPQDPIVRRSRAQASDHLWLPDTIKADLVGICRGLNLGQGLTKLLFAGPEGTGKKESVKHMAKLLKLQLHTINLSRILSVSTDQTEKNIRAMFDEIQCIPYKENAIILCNEFELISSSFPKSDDRQKVSMCFSAELSRLTDPVFVAVAKNKGSLNSEEYGGFDAVIDFNRYSSQDLKEIAQLFLDFYLDEYGYEGKRNNRLFRKIIDTQLKQIPSPGEWKKLIQKAVSFSDIKIDQDYLRRIFLQVTPKENQDIKALRSSGFSLREIGVLTAVSKTQISRILARD
jgi:SpoVK/Ycf46/Vps4 family AAA+-type ATPase